MTESWTKQQVLVQMSHCPMLERKRYLCHNNLKIRPHWNFVNYVITSSLLIATFLRTKGLIDQGQHPNKPNRKWGGGDTFRTTTKLGMDADRLLKCSHLEYSSAFLDLTWIIHQQQLNRASIKENMARKLESLTIWHFEAYTGPSLDSFKELGPISLQMS